MQNLKVFELPIGNLLDESDELLAITVSSIKMGRLNLRTS